jgi:hypothetical protein
MTPGRAARGGSDSDGGLPSAEHLKANPMSDHNTGDAYDFTAKAVRVRAAPPEPPTG